MSRTLKARHAPSGRTHKRVVILGLPPVDSLDAMGPAEVFAFANTLHRSDVRPYLLELVAAGADLQLETSTGIGLMAHKTLQQERDAGTAIDTLIVVSGWKAEDQLDEAAIDWIRTRSESIRRVCSICVGAFALARAGLLNRRRATTHWRVARKLAERYPLVQVDPNPIWVKDGNLYTSAGVSAGIDLALALVSEDLGDEVAMEVAKNLVLFLRRPGGQAQFSAALQSQQVSGSNLDELCVWINEHPNSQLTVEILADKLCTSVRTLIRLFQRELQTTPAKYVETVRVEAACRSIELGIGSMEEIARRSGYQSVDVMRKAFMRRLGVSPKEYAQRFSPDSVWRTRPVAPN